MASKLLSDWVPPKGLSSSVHAAPEVPEIEYVEESEVKTYYYGGFNTDRSGVVYQRCGGGRRLIRKQIGSI